VTTELEAKGAALTKSRRVLSFKHKESSSICQPQLVTRSCSLCLCSCLALAWLDYHIDILLSLRRWYAVYSSQGGKGANHLQIWPSTLANAALFQTLHSGANPIADGWRISRYRFFLYVFIGSFCWYWLPGYIFTGLSTFAFICWASPSTSSIYLKRAECFSNKLFRRQQSA
jgi:hypothetical protein